MNTFLDEAISKSSDKISSAISTLASLDMTRKSEDTFVASINQMPQASGALIQLVSEYITLINARAAMLEIVKNQEEAVPATQVE